MEPADEGGASQVQANLGAGATLFQDKGCGNCHAVDAAGDQPPPGLEGLFDRETLPASGEPVTAETVRQQLVDPYANMPSYEDRLTEDEIDQIVDYLQTL